MQEYTEETIKDFIKSGKVVVKGWQDDCNWCDEYAPIMDEVSKQFPDIKFGSIKIAKDGPSEFRRTHMVAKKGESLGAPMTFIFKDGEQVARHYGKMEAGVLAEFININLKDYTLEELRYMKGELHEMQEIAKFQLSVVESKLPWVNAKISQLHANNQRDMANPAKTA